MCTLYSKRLNWKAGIVNTNQEYKKFAFLKKIWFNVCAMRKRSKVERSNKYPWNSFLCKNFSLHWDPCRILLPILSPERRMVKSWSILGKEGMWYEINRTICLVSHAKPLSTCPIKLLRILKSSVMRIFLFFRKLKIDYLQKKKT